MNEKEVRKAIESFRDMDELTQAQQTMHRVAHWLERLMGPDEAEKWIEAFSHPDPIQDWYTGHEIGDVCPTHGKRLSSLTPYERTRLSCEAQKEGEICCRVPE